MTGSGADPVCYLNTAMVLGYPNFGQDGMVPSEYRPVTGFRGGAAEPETEE